MVRGQYQQDLSYGQRVDLLENVLDTTLANFQAGDLNLGAEGFFNLNDSVTAGELIFVPTDPIIRTAFRQLGTTAHLPESREDINFFGLVEQNTGLDKLDPYLEREARLVWDSWTIPN